MPQHSLRQQIIKYCEKATAVEEFRIQHRIDMLENLDALEDDDESFYRDLIEMHKIYAQFGIASKSAQKFVESRRYLTRKGSVTRPKPDSKKRKAQNITKKAKE